MEHLLGKSLPEAEALDDGNYRSVREAKGY